MVPIIRNEQPADIAAIARLTKEAFQTQEHSSHTEHLIVDALRDLGELTISLVAVDGDAIVGHVAISPVTISSGAEGWFGLGPISVRPDRQGEGIGSALVLAALDNLRANSAAGCVLLGNPAFYGRFGFAAQPDLVLPGVPAHSFQAISFDGDFPQGHVAYSDAFNMSA